MEEKDWLFLDILFEEKNITKTAQRLYISQPSLTYRIQQIEKEFGIPIILRSKKGVVFTEEGTLIAQYAKRMLQELQKFKDQVANTKNVVKGVLRLGVSSTFAHYQLPGLLKNFLDCYPDVEVNVKTGWSTGVLQNVYKEEVHIGIVRGDIDWTDEKHRVYSEPINIVSKQEIALEQLPKYPRINYKTDFPLKMVIDNWWQLKYKTIPPNVTMEVDNIQTCKELVKMNLGYAILPSVCLKESDGLSIHPLVLPTNDIVLRDTWLIYRNEMLELSVIRAFVDFSKEYFSKNEKKPVSP